MLCSIHMKSEVVFTHRIILNGTPAEKYMLKVTDRNIKLLSWMRSTRIIKASELNPFHTNVPFPCLLKISENLWFSYVSRWYRKGALAWNRLIEVVLLSLLLTLNTLKTITQAVFTCSKSTIETLEQGVKYIQS